MRALPMPSVNVGASIERVFGRSTVRTKPGLKGRYSLPETCLVTPSRHRKPPYGSLRATKRSVAIVMPLRFEIFRIVLAGTLDSTASKRSLTFTLSQLVGDPDLTKGWLLNRERNDGVFDLLRHAVLQHRLSPSEPYVPTQADRSVEVNERAARFADLVAEIVRNRSAH